LCSSARFSFLCGVIIHVLGMLDSAQLTSLQAFGERYVHEICPLDMENEELILPQLWDTDALVLIDWAKTSKLAKEALAQWVSLSLLCGRPALYTQSGQALSVEQLGELLLKPRTNYVPVDCGYYDHFESAIIKRQAQRIRLTCFDESNEKGATQQLKILGTKTWRKEEFVEVEGYGWLRADWVEMVDVSPTGSCSL